MKRKLLLLLLVATLVLSLAPLVACGGNPGRLVVEYDTSHVVYEGDSLDSLKPYMTVTYKEWVGVYQLTDFRLSGTLTEGDCLITVYYRDISETITITVLKRPSGDDEYTVTLDYDGATGGNTQQTITVTYNQPIGDLPTPTKDYCTFIGWYLDDEKVTADTIWTRTGNALTLIAKWRLSSIEVDGLAYKLNDDGESYCVVDRGDVTDRDIVIPATFNNKPVTSIDNYAFYNTNITSISIPDSIERINSDAFLHCYSLQFNVYNNARYLGNANNPFLALVEKQDASITSCTIHEDTKIICYYAFRNCSNLTSVTLGSNVTYIGAAAFGGCSNLTSVYYTGDIADWCNICFNDDTGIDGYDSNPLCNGADLYVDNQLVTELEIPATVTKLYPYAFYNCQSLTGVEIPEGITYVPKSAFGFCSNLTSVSIPNSAPAIGEYAFERCSSLENVSIGSGLKVINAYAFYYCSSLKAITIPDSVTAIGNNAFEHCTGLKTVVMGSGMKSIGNYAFNDCGEIATVYYKGTADSWKGIGIFERNINLTNATRYYYETNPQLNDDGTAYVGNYWHYVGDVPTVWVKE